MINDNNLTLLGVKCVSCKKFDHTLNECSYIHYVTNRFNLISRFNVSSEITDRVKIKRRWPLRKRANPLVNVIYYTEIAYDYGICNQQYIDEVLNYEEESYISSYSDYSEGQSSSSSSSTSL